MQQTTAMPSTRNGVQQIPAEWVWLHVTAVQQGCWSQAAGGESWQQPQSQDPNKVIQTTECSVGAAPRVPPPMHQPPAAWHQQAALMLTLQGCCITRQQVGMLATASGSGNGQRPVSPTSSHQHVTTATPRRFPK